MRDNWVRTSHDFSKISRIHSSVSDFGKIGVGLIQQILSKAFPFVGPGNPELSKTDGVLILMCWPTLKICGNCSFDKCSEGKAWDNTRRLGKGTQPLSPLLWGTFQVPGNSQLCLD